MNEHVCKKDKTELKWFVFYTGPRVEKAVYKELVSKGYEVFLPLQKKMKIWKNRQCKFIEEPLFPSYIFVRTHSAEVYNIVKTRGVYICIRFEGKSCTVPDKDIEVIRIMIQSEQEISSNNDFRDGEKVLIIQGPLRGYKGVLFKQKGKNKFGIRIQEIDLIAAIDISMEDIQKLKD